MAGLFNSNFDTLSMAMDSTMLRHKVISQNMANVDTPGYKRREVSFEDYLASAMGDSDKLPLKTTDEKHISNVPTEFSEVKPGVIRIDDTGITIDGNNVDVDRENAIMSENGIRYLALTRLMEINIGNYNTVLRGFR